MLSKPHASDGPYWNLRGNGGMLSTLGDMAAFYRTLLETSTLLRPETRALRFAPDEPIALAGSDLVNVFLYERFPRLHVDIIIATNNAEFRERPVREAIGTVLGLPSPDGGARAGTTQRANAKPPSNAVASLLREFVAAVNSGDAGKLSKFVAEHFLIDPGTPDADARAQRFVGMHGNLGDLQVVGMDQIEATVVELSALSANEGRLTMRFELAGDGQVKGVQVLVGG